MNKSVDMGDRVSAAFYPEKGINKKIFYRRVTRIIIAGSLLNFLLVSLMFFISFSDKLGKFISLQKEKFILADTSKRTISNSFDHKPFLYAGHSFPTDSVGNVMNRDSHYARQLYLLNPSQEEQFQVTTTMHEVLKGQTLFSIAKLYNVSIASIKLANDLTNDDLKQGTILRIQKSGKPLGYYGIDVSSWQNSIDWNFVHQDSIPSLLKFFIIKATQGKDIVDAYFKHNWEMAKTKNTLVGAYHFYVSDEDPILQANNYIANVKLIKGDIYPIIDLEFDCGGCNSLHVSKAEYVKNLKTFLKTIEERFKVKPILYSFPFFYSEYLKGDFGDYNYWMASYSKNPPIGMCTKDADSLSVIPSVFMWQFSCSERIKGVVGNVDISYVPVDLLNPIVIQ